jgi:ribosomal-protein-alanine N-acetyltransferase
MPSLRIRAGTPDDFPWIARLLDENPEAGHWLPEAYPFLVAEPEAGFLCWREISSSEFEVLNLAVARSSRRRGIAKALLHHAGVDTGEWYLEVRESNSAAQFFYQSAGFQIAGRRKKYYKNPLEDAIVLRRKGC